MNRGHALQQAGQLDAAIAIRPSHRGVARSALCGKSRVGQQPRRRLDEPRPAAPSGPRCRAHRGNPRVLRRRGRRCAGEFVEERNPWVRRNLAGTLCSTAPIFSSISAKRPLPPPSRAKPWPPVSRTSAAIRSMPTSRSRPGALADALGRLLVAGADRGAALATEASDLADDALALIRHWNNPGSTAFRPLAIRFFRYDAATLPVSPAAFPRRVHRGKPPPAGTEFRVIALEALNAALAERPRGRSYLTVGDPGLRAPSPNLDRVLEVLRRRLAA